MIFAELIMTQCVENEPERPIPARIDGLRIAGSVLFRDGSLAGAKEAFSAIVGLTNEPRWLAESHRMLGQIAFGNGLFQDALAAFESSVTNALLDDPNGDFLSTQSSLSQACATACLLGQHQVALDHALTGIDLFPHPGPTSDPSGPFYYWAYLASKGLHDTAAAADYLDTLLDRHPDYGDDDLFLGLKPMLLLDRHHLRGEGWNNPTQPFLDTVSTILSDEKYRLMPTRANVAERFASFLESNGQAQIAAEIADYAVKSAANAAAADPTLDAALLNALGRANAELALENVKRKLHRLHNPESSAQSVSRLLESGLPVPPEIQAAARAKYFEATRQEYQPAP